MDDFDKLVAQQPGVTFDFYGVDNNYFKVDDKVFEVQEDPSYGYRSYLGLVEIKEDTKDLIFFRHPIATVKIGTPENGGINEYSLVDVSDGHEWLVFGTDDYDDYYPVFFFQYHPKASE